MVAVKILVTAEEARGLIGQAARQMAPVQASLPEAAGCILAKDIYAGITIPAFRQSGMDGFAFLFDGGHWPLRLVGEMAAGSHDSFSLQPGEAVRIFTGAAVPTGADTVLVQEKARVEDGYLHIEDANLVAGANVRPVGSEVKAGELALSEGSLLSPAAIGFLAGIGITEVEIYPAPRVSIIVTGNELQTPGHPLEFGQVYEANSFALSAALGSLQMEPMAIYRSADDPGQLTEILDNALVVSDVVLITGGVSVGDYDFTEVAFEACGVEKVFHKVKQKPGKPLLFGRKGEKLVFGLPGNPASVLACFYMYVLGAFSAMSGQRLSLPIMQAPLSVPYKKPEGLTHFLKGHYDGSVVNLLTGQESYKLNSFAMANCLVEVPAETTELAMGDMVKVHVINNLAQWM